MPGVSPGGLTAELPGVGHGGLAAELPGVSHAGLTAELPGVSPGGHAGLTAELSGAEETLTLESATSVATRPLPPLTVDPADVAYRPAVFLGIGGLGGLVLSGLRRRWSSGSATATRWRPLPLLYVDTDPRSIAAAWARATSSPGSVRNPLHTASRSAVLPLPPCRGPALDQPAMAVQHPSLASRWKASAPWVGWPCATTRSRSAAGIQQILQRATAEDSLRAAQRPPAPASLPARPPSTSSLPCPKGPGSGAALDVAYLLRTVLAQIKLECQAIVGVLLHATSAQGSRGQIQNATGLACLDELRRTSTPPGWDSPAIRPAGCQASIAAPSIRPTSSIWATD